MAYHRSGPGALALNSHLHRRRALLKRNIRHARANEDQAVVIGPGGVMNLQPVAAIPADTNTAQYYSSETANRGSTTINVQEDRTRAHLDSNGQMPLRQAPPTNRPVNPTESIVKEPLTSSSVPPVAFDVPVSTVHPKPNQTSPPLASAYSTIISLAVSPVSESLPPLLGSHPPIRSTRTLSATRESGTTSTDTETNPSETTDLSPPLSQNPPIIVGILMATLLGIAAMVALVSWLTRSSLRRRRNRIESRSIEADGSGRSHTMTGSPSFEEKNAEEGIKHFEHPNSSNTEANPPFYIEPHSTIFTHDNYPADNDLYDSMRTPNGAYLPSGPNTIVPYNKPPRGPRTTNTPLGRGGFHGPPRPRGSRRSSWEDAPGFLTLDVEGSNVPENVRPKDLLPSILHDEPVLEASYSEPISPPQTLPPPGFSWATALRSNLVSALDAVKLATAEKRIQAPSTSVPSETSPTSEDKFTLLALRPARKSLARFPLQSTGEGDLTFGGTQAPENSRSMSTSSSGIGSDDDGGGQKRHAITLGGLGRFSFEQRMRKGALQGRNNKPQRDPHSRLAVHSTALSRRRSGMTSGSVSSANSVTASESASDTTMRKRKS